MHDGRTRFDKRRDFARTVNRYGEIPARKYGVTRTSEITGLDHVGIPVWTSIRPKSKTVSVNAGKSLDPAMAKAGAIIEGVEFGAAEMPKGEWTVAAETQWTAPHLTLDRMPFARGAIYRPDVPVAWDLCLHLNNRSAYWVPSDLIWMVRRAPTPFSQFQMSSNGLGAGYSREDALLSAIYEVVERDAWSLFLYAKNVARKMPVKVDPAGLEGDAGLVLDKARSAGLTPFLFDITSELGIPVFYAVLYDLGLDSVGSFGGYGCHFDPCHAMTRALLEAAQSRVAYLAGARDDLFRRSFLLLKRNDQQRDVRVLDALPFGSSAADYVPLPFADESDELRFLLKRLERHGFYDVLCSELTREPIEHEHLHVVRAVVPGLETYQSEDWQPTRRAIEHVQRC